MSVPKDETTPPVGAQSELGWANAEMGPLGLDIRCKRWWIANHSSALLNQGKLDVSAQGQDNPPVWVRSKLGWANVEMGAFGLAIRCQLSLQGTLSRPSSFGADCTSVKAKAIQKPSWHLA